jgi:hypothetical protein
MYLAFPGPLGLEAGFGAFLTRFQSCCRAAQGFREVSGRKSAPGIDKPLCDQAGEEYVMKRADGFCCATADSGLLLAEKERRQAGAGEMNVLGEDSDDLMIEVPLKIGNSISLKDYGSAEDWVRSTTKADAERVAL